ncbi:MAG TPA: hypothetical protein VN969_05870 [Streptosporangiaceae bacterium]|nr:hypothetical protein [Streptosporangiaceae bacterium]
MMGYPNISKGTRGGRRTCAMLGGTLAAATVISLGVGGTAQAAVAPTADLSFSSATVSAGSQPQMTFLSHGAPSGALLYLEESSDGGQQWKTVDKTTDTQGTANLAAISEGVYQFKILITDNNTVIGASAPAALTVTGPGDAQPAAPASAAPAPGPTSAPSGSGVSWLQVIVKPIWDTIVGWLIGFILSWL